MSLIFLVANNAWVFLFGDAPLRLSDESLFFPSRKEAIEAAKRHGLDVNGRGRVNPLVGCEV